MNIRHSFLLIALAGTSLISSPAGAAKTTSSKSSEPANVVDVSAGQLDVSLDPAFTTALRGIAGVVTSFHGTVLSTPAGASAGTRGFRVYGGEVDTNSGEGEFETVGNLQFTNGLTTIELRHLTLDTTGALPVVTAETIINGAVTGRVPVFTLTANDLFPAPLKGTAFATPAAPTVISDGFVTLFNSYFPKAMWIGMGTGTVSVAGTIGTIS